MRVAIVVLSLFVVVFPCAARAQLFTVHGAAGPTLVDRGYTLVAGGGIVPTRHLSVLFDVERTHLSSRSTSDGRGGTSEFRGGTLTLGSAQLRVAPFGHGRLGPYGLAGVAAGVSRPNVNEAFPTRVTNDVWAIFFGGGLFVPLTDQLNAYVDGRMLVGDEAGELLAVLPIRGGLAWRF
jgi:hypothetical protein